MAQLQSGNVVTERQTKDFSITQKTDINWQFIANTD